MTSESIEGQQQNRFPGLGRGRPRSVGQGHKTVKPDRLLKQMRQVLRSRHYSRSTEKTYCH